VLRRPRAKAEDLALDWQLVRRGGRGGTHEQLKCPEKERCGVAHAVSGELGCRRADNLGRTGGVRPQAITTGQFLALEEWEGHEARSHHADGRLRGYSSRGLWLASGQHPRMSVRFGAMSRPTTPVAPHEPGVVATRRHPAGRWPRGAANCTENHSTPDREGRHVEVTRERQRRSHADGDVRPRENAPIALR